VDCQVLEDALLDLLETVVVLVTARYSRMRSLTFSRP